jgi:hypothetical protein
MESQPGVISAQSHVGRSFGKANNNDYVTITLQIDSGRVDDPGRARAVARRVIAAYPAAADKDMIGVTFTYGYNMVIASGWRAHGFSFDPDELAEE